MQAGAGIDALVAGRWELKTVPEWRACKTPRTWGRRRLRERVSSASGGIGEPPRAHEGTPVLTVPSWDSHPSLIHGEYGGGFPAWLPEGGESWNESRA